MKILFVLFIIICVILLSIFLFTKFHPVFWWNPDSLPPSQHYQNKRFVNKYPTAVQSADSSTWSILKDYITNNQPRVPNKKLPTYVFEKQNFSTGSFTWFGHSTILMNIDGKNIITDPVFYKASPVFFGGTPFEYSHTPSIWELPNIDVVVISHDHYDHLDYRAIVEMDEKVSQYFVPLWVEQHFKRWWIDEKKISVFDWYEEKQVDDLNFIFTPSQHFSWRWLTNRNTTLWGSWVIDWTQNKYFFSGDTGYFDEFKNIWEKYGPFDIAFIENGAYNDAWSEIHMLPEQSVQVGLDLKAKNIMPIHWWKFDLSLHAWYEPIERFISAAQTNNISYFHPEIWKIFSIDTLPKNNWWADLIEKK